MPVVARSIHEAWTGIAAAVEQQSYATREISERMAEAARNSDTVTAGIAIVTGEAERTTDEAHRVFAAATDLARQAQGLQREIISFLKDVAAA